MSETISASDLHPDVLALTQKISDKASQLVSQVETLDANNWLTIADEIDALNSQLQAMLVAKPVTSKKS
jgi:hypothetical protein